MLSLFALGAAPSGAQGHDRPGGDPDRTAEDVPAAPVNAEAAVIQVSSTVDFTNGQTEVSPDDNTFLGVVNTSSGSADQSFTIENTGDATMGSLAVNIGGANAGAFSLQSGPDATLDPGGSTTFTIRFDPSSEGLLVADLTVSSPDASSDFTFRVGGIGDDDIDASACQTLTCYDVDAMDPEVCSGNGECVAEDTCDCDDEYLGTECQIPLEWASGGLEVTSTIDFSPRLFVGPALTDPNAVYRVKIKISEWDNLSGSNGITIGVINVSPVDFNHDIGTNGEEWGYRSLSGRKIHNNNPGNFGDTYETGDVVLVEYDAPNGTLDFKLRKEGESEFVDQSGEGPAFTGVEATEGKDLYIGLSVTCFGKCVFTLVP